MDPVLDNASGPMLHEEYTFVEWLIRGVHARSVLEIGTGRGQGLLRYHETDVNLLVTVDVNMRTIYHFQGADVFERLGKVSFIEGSSHDGEVIRRVGLHAPYDVIILDGDHTFQAVKQDFAAYFPLLREQGACLMHDIEWGEVSLFWAKGRDLSDLPRYSVMPNLGLVIRGSH